jgi:hypothetical protein
MREAFKVACGWLVLISVICIIYSVSFNFNLAAHKDKKPTRAIIKSFYKVSSLNDDTELKAYTSPRATTIGILKNADVFLVSKIYGNWMYGNTENNIYGYVQSKNLKLCNTYE